MILTRNLKLPNESRGDRLKNITLIPKKGALIQGIPQIEKIIPFLLSRRSHLLL